MICARSPAAAPSLVSALPKSVSPASRKSRWAERPRAATAASMTVAGTPRSCASIADQRPVPFWPAVSRMISTIGRPVSGSLASSTLAVISIR